MKVRLLKSLTGKNEELRNQVKFFGKDSQERGDLFYRTRGKQVVQVEGRWYREDGKLRVSSIYNDKFGNSVGDIDNQVIESSIESAAERIKNKADKLAGK